ncbi:hypothetical protein HYH02_012156 [Chlamydomonas schloesseri]|uniref:EF-hand domain-containing protein n=1 Tax=Chlamydomonas schloesseri TaxID=2026947 RepID=A0A835TBH9_9CHLO|nr:hypothetical protein HYH02_012156 [Chlamydomonas schloesseri]|eukprot:KAG2434960.1 hypothetical protein HYH02_012156 [Chlamydomonas schloesseri]
MATPGEGSSVAAAAKAAALGAASRHALSHNSTDAGDGRAKLAPRTSKSGMRVSLPQVPDSAPPAAADATSSPAAAAAGPNNARHISVGGIYISPEAPGALNGRGAGAAAAGTAAAAAGEAQPAATLLSLSKRVSLAGLHAQPDADAESNIDAQASAAAVASDTKGGGARPSRSLTRNRSFSQVRSMGRAASRRALKLHGCSRDSSPPSTSHSARSTGSPTPPYRDDVDEEEEDDAGQQEATEGSGHARGGGASAQAAGTSASATKAGQEPGSRSLPSSRAAAPKTDDDLAAEAARWAAEAAAEAEIDRSSPGELPGSETVASAVASAARALGAAAGSAAPSSGHAQGRSGVAGLDALVSADAAAAAAKMALLQKQQHQQQQQPSLVWRSAHSIHGLDKVQRPHGSIRHYQVTVKPEHTQAVRKGIATNGTDTIPHGGADGAGPDHVGKGSRTNAGMAVANDVQPQSHLRPADVAGVHPSGAVTHRSARFASDTGDGVGASDDSSCASGQAGTAAMPGALGGQAADGDQALQPQPPQTARTARSVRVREPDAGVGSGGGDASSTAAAVGISALKGSRSSRAVSVTGDGAGSTGAGEGTADGVDGGGGGASSRRARIMSAAPGWDRAGVHDGIAATASSSAGVDVGSEGLAEYHRSTASARVGQLLLLRARSAVPSVRDVLGSGAVKDIAGECWHRMPAVALDLNHTPDLDLVPLGAKSALTGAPVTRVPRSKSARPVPGGVTACAGGGLWTRGKAKSVLYSDSGSDSDLSAGDAAHLDASLWGGHPEILGADAAARPLRTTKSFIMPLSSRAAESKSAMRSARAKEGTASQRTTAGGASTGAGVASGPSRRSSTVGGDEGLVAGSGSGAAAGGSGLQAKALASLMVAAADDPLLAHVMENARKRAAEEREKRRAAAAAAAAAAGGSAAGGGGAADSLWTGDGDHGEDGSTPSVATRRAQEKARAQLLFQRQAEDWARAHGAAPPRRRLAPAVTKMVEQWFALVDDDSSGALEVRELAAALSAAGVPCDESDIRELVRIIDVNHDGSVTWAEFQSFLLREFAAGKNLINGDYVLPSGKRLPFGAMIARLKRQRVLEDVLAGGQSRNKYVDMLYKPKALAEELGLTREAAAALEKLVRTNADDAAAAAAASQATGSSAGLVRTASMALASLSRATSPRHLYQKHAYYQTMRQHESDVGDQINSETTTQGGQQAGSQSCKFKIQPLPVSKKVLLPPAVPAAAKDEQTVAAANVGAVGAEDGAAEAGEGCDDAGASMYHKLNAGASVLHSVYSAHVAADAEGTAAPGDARVENPVFKLTEVGLTAEDPDEDEDEAGTYPGTVISGQRPFPGPIIPPVPTIRRPDTRAFKRALIGARRTAPAYLLQRYGLPEPRVAAAAAAASGPGALPPPPLRGAERRRSRSRRRAAGTAAATNAGAADSNDGNGQLSPVASAATVSDLLGGGPSASSLATAAVPLKVAAASSAANAAATVAQYYNAAYGAGMTRYRRWSQIDPAAENPDYWQAKAAALLMQHTKRIFKDVPGAGGARARAAAAASAAVAAAEAASRGLYSPPTTLEVSPPSHQAFPGLGHASAPASPGGGPSFTSAAIASAAAGIHLPDAQELLQKHAALQQQHKEERQVVREAVRRAHTDQLLQRLRYDAAVEMSGGDNVEVDNGMGIYEDAEADGGLGQAGVPVTAAAAAAVAAARRAAAEAALGFSRQGARPARRPGGAICVQAPAVFSGVGTATIANTAPTRQVARRPQPNAASSAQAMAARRRRAPPPAISAALIADALSPDGGSPNGGRDSPSGWEQHAHLPQLHLPSPAGCKGSPQQGVAAGGPAAGGAASPASRARRLA